MYVREPFSTLRCRQSRTPTTHHHLASPLRILEQLDLDEVTHYDACPQARQTNVESSSVTFCRQTTLPRNISIKYVLVARKIYGEN